MFHSNMIIHDFIRPYHQKVSQQWSNNSRNTLDCCKLDCIAFFTALQWRNASATSPSSAYCAMVAGWRKLLAVRRWITHSHSSATSTPQRRDEERGSDGYDLIPQSIGEMQQIVSYVMALAWLCPDSPRPSSKLPLPPHPPPPRRTSCSL